MNLCETRMTCLCSAVGPGCVLRLRKHPEDSDDEPHTLASTSCFFSLFFKGQRRIHEAEFVVLGLAERMQLGPKSHSGMIELA